MSPISRCSRKSPTALIAALALVITPTSVRAQPGAQVVRMADGSTTLPTDLMVDPQNPAGEAWKIWVADAGFFPKAQPRAAAPPAINPDLTRGLHFMFPAYLIAVHPKDAVLDPERADPEADVWLLIARADESQRSISRIYGWVPARTIVRKTQPLRTDLKIFKKRFLINTVDSLAKAAGKSPSPEGGRTTTGAARASNDSTKGLVPVSLCPDSSGYRESYRLMNIYFSYAETRNAVLIGLAPQFADVITPNTPRDELPWEVVRGWVPKERTIGWDTRDVVDWDLESTHPTPPASWPEILTWPRRTKRGKVFRESGDAYAALAAMPSQGGEPKGDDGVVVYERPFDNRGVAVELIPEQMRFPALKFKPSEGRSDPDRDPRTNNELIRVAAFASYRGGKVIPPGQFAEWRTRLDELRKALSNQQILIVIDRTESCYIHFPAIAKFVQSLVNRVGPSGRTELAVSYYDDTEEYTRPDGFRVQGPGGQANEMMDLATSRNLILSDLQAQQVVNGVDKDERVFDGVVKAVKKVVPRFDADPSVRKVVIVIGDYPDKRKPGDPGPEDLARLLDNKRWWPVEFHAIQIVDPADPRATPFKEQMETVVNGLNSRGVGKTSTYTTLGKGASEPLDPLSPAATAALLETLNQRFDTLVAERDDLQRKLDLAVRGNTSLGDVGPELKNMLKTQLRDDVDLEALFDREGGEISLTGYVWAYVPGQVRDARSPGIRQVRRQLLIARAELEILRKQVKALFTKVDAETEVGGTITDRTVAAVKGAIVSASGDQKFSGSFSDAVFMQLGIQARSPLLSRDLTAITPSLARRELVKVRNRLERIEDLLDTDVDNLSVQWTWKVIQTEDGGPVTSYERVPGTQVRKKRFFRFPGNTIWYCWLDDEEELP